MGDGLPPDVYATAIEGMVEMADDDDLDTIGDGPLDHLAGMDLAVATALVERHRDAIRWRRLLELKDAATASTVSTPLAAGGDDRSGSRVCHRQTVEWVWFAAVTNEGTVEQGPGNEDGEVIYSVQLRPARLGEYLWVSLVVAAVLAVAAFAVSDNSPLGVGVGLVAALGTWLVWRRIRPSPPPISARRAPGRQG